MPDSVRESDRVVDRDAAVLAPADYVEHRRERVIPGVEDPQLCDVPLIPGLPHVCEVAPPRVRPPKCGPSRVHCRQD